MQTRQDHAPAAEPRGGIIGTELERKLAALPALANLRAVFRYLAAQGWKISERTVYKHHEEGNLSAGRDGRYPVKSVDRYARRHLTRLDGTTSPDSGDDTDQSARQAADLRLRTAQAEIYEEKLRNMRGAYVPKETVERALANRAAIFVADAVQRDRLAAAEISVRYALGPEAEQEIIELLRLGRVSMFARYSEPLTFELPGSKNAPPVAEDKQ